MKSWGPDAKTRRAVERFEALAHGRCARASLLATCPDARYRTGEVAVRDATVALDVARESGQLITNWKHRLYLETLATVLAERGDFDAAVRVEQEALPFCLTRINEETANARIAQFRAGMPLRVEEGLVCSRLPRRTG
jgi:hypothetical protein